MKADETDKRAAVDQVVKPAQEPTRSDLLLRLKKFEGLLPADFKFDRDEANSR